MPASISFSKCQNIVFFVERSRFWVSVMQNNLRHSDWFKFKSKIAGEIEKPAEYASLICFKFVLLNLFNLQGSPAYFHQRPG